MSRQLWGRALRIAPAVVACVLALSGCSAATRTQADSAPTFSGLTGDQSYAVGQIVDLTLPSASSGNGGLTYTLQPKVTGLTFDAETRTLRGTPTEAGSHDMTYRVVDGDGNSADSDADVLRFKITAVLPRGILHRYDGSGDRVFALNAQEEVLANTPYTLLLGDATATVYVVAANTNGFDVKPRIDRLDVAQGAAAVPLPAPAGPSPAATATGRQWVAAFNDDPPRPPPADGVLPTAAGSPEPVAEGDAHTFVDTPDGVTVIEVPAIARRVVTDGSLSLAVWVADEHWGDCPACVDQAMVDAVAGRVLREEGGNDLHDWVTAVFGEPWGAHDHGSFLIPAEQAGWMHLLLYDVEGDGAYFSAVNNHRRGDGSYVSNERLLIYADAPTLAAHDGEDWELTDSSPSGLIAAVAHELQHMIHFYQKLVRHGYEAVSEPWLNEMASLVAEDLVADKIMAAGPRGVAHDDPTAGAAQNGRGLLPTYNRYHDVQASRWEHDAPLHRYSAVNYALGSYLARAYGGAALFGAIVRSDRSGIDAIEAALADLDHSVSFADVLVNWGVAGVLSDDAGAPHPYRYNTGTWSTSEAGGVTFRLGSIDLFKYRSRAGDEPDDYHDGPSFHSTTEFNTRGAQPPHSNRFVALGSNEISVRLRVSAPPGTYVTVVVKK